MKILDWLSGYYIVRSEKGHGLSVLNRMIRARFPYRSAEKSENNELIFKIRIRDHKTLKTLLDKSGEMVYIVYRGGLPFRLLRYRRRVGIVLGAVMAAALISISTKYIWDIDIVGNSSVSDEEILSELSELGCAVGSYIPELDIFELPNRYLLRSSAIAWITVNIDGTVAHVQVRERVERPENDVSPSNLIAATDGQIHSLAVYDGENTVEVGDTVRAGELIVSGIAGDDERGYRLVRSKGSVYAYTRRELSTSVPLSRPNRRYTGECMTVKSFRFFEKTLKFSLNTGNSPTMYDTITYSENLTLPWNIKLPIRVITETRRGFVYESVELTESEAEAEAYAELSRRFVELYPNAELLERSDSCEISDGELYMSSTFTCLEDIAKEVKIGY